MRGPIEEHRLFLLQTTPPPPRPLGVGCTMHSAKAWGGGETGEGAEFHFKRVAGGVGGSVGWHPPPAVLVLEGQYWPPHVCQKAIQMGRFGTQTRPKMGQKHLLPPDSPGCSNHQPPRVLCLRGVPTPLRTLQRGNGSMKPHKRTRKAAAFAGDNQPQ